MFFPLMIDLEQMNIVIVGGGKIALRKFNSIIDYSKSIKVISPKFCEEFTEAINNFKSKKEIEIINREVTTSDLEDSNIVFLATDNSELNSLLSEFCKSKNILVNSVDNHINSSFVNMGTIRADGFIEGVDEAIIGVSLFGKNPKMLKKIKERLKIVIEKKLI